jgi:hypothetical protein
MPENLNSAVRWLKKLLFPPGRRQRTHFLHIGKTGGTSVKHALAGHLDGRNFVIKLHPHETTLADIPRGERVFFFLRDPITRFVSGFNSRLRMGRPRIHVPWKPAEKLAFERFTTPDRLAQALGSENAEERTAAENALRGIGHVRDFYATWFKSEEYFLSRLDDILLIGFQESLGKDFECLKARLRLPAAVQLPQDEIRTHKTPANFDQTLQPNSVEILNRWYQDDVRFYAFCQKLVAEKKLNG